MADRKTLKNYLVGEKGYLLNPDNNHKTIMISGKWGSGKTYFWKEDIIPSLDQEDNKIPNHYISLYGKTSIEQIKSEIFTEIFKSSNPSELESKGLKVAKSTINAISSVSKAISIFGIEVDLSKVTEKPFEALEKTLDDIKLKDTINYLNSNAIICFDDFERKSKDIDLNDLFGFISQLTIEFQCKVVVILNDNVFEAEEKKVFSNVKEKTVSKYLYYSPTIEELFESIYTSSDKYNQLDNYKERILETIEKTEELNARIYIQVLDNLTEWIGNNLEDNENIVRCIILVNINFILYHTVITLYKDYTFDIQNKYFSYVIKNIQTSSILHKICKKIDIKNFKNRHFSITDLKYKISKIEPGATSESEVDEQIKLIEIYPKEIESFHFSNYVKIHQNLSIETFNKINYFIETGILPNE